MNKIMGVHRSSFSVSSRGPAMSEEREVPEGAAVFPVIPPELGVHPLLLAVLHAVVFLEGSGEEIVEPSAAEEALDHLAIYFRPPGEMAKGTGPVLEGFPGRL
jgi:hypothetical protein